jgi:hypothetical protein
MKTSESLNISGSFPAEHDASPKPLSRAKEKRVNRCVTVRQPLTEHVNRLVVTYSESNWLHLDLNMAVVAVVSIQYFLILYFSTRYGYEVLWIILLQEYLYTYSLLRGVTFEVLPLSSYALSPVTLPALETFLGPLLWNSFWCHRPIFFNVFNILKYSSF